MTTALNAMAVNFDVSTESGLRHLDDYLLTRTYISGHQASRDDVAVYVALSQHPQNPGFINLSRWYTHINALLQSKFSGPAVGVIFTPVTAAADNEHLHNHDHDLARTTTEQEGESSSAAAAAAAVLGTTVIEGDDENSTAAFGKGHDLDYANGDLMMQHEDYLNGHLNPPPIDNAVLLHDELNGMAQDEIEASRNRNRNRSSILLDVKPWDDETDMAKLEEAVRNVQIPGLHWGASTLVQVVPQISKLQIMMTIDDDLVSPENVIEENLTTGPPNEHIQSCDIVAWNQV